MLVTLARQSDRFNEAAASMPRKITCRPYPCSRPGSSRFNEAAASMPRKIVSPLGHEDVVRHRFNEAAASMPRKIHN